MAQIVGAERGSEFGGLTKFGSDLTNAAFGQRSALAKKEMPIRPATPGSNRFSPDHRPLSPVFSQVFAVFEIGIERFAHFLDERDLAMLESFAPSNDEQAAPSGDLHVRDLEGCDIIGTVLLSAQFLARSRPQLCR